jgi:DNA-binding NarL/FixJ family response regulator
LSDPVLLERDSELRQLDLAVERAAAADGSVVVVEGPAGVGKSTLIAAASGRAQAAGVRVLSARGSELEREFGFGALRQLFEGALASREPAERKRLLSGAAQPAEPVLALETRPDAGAGDGFTTLHAIYWLALNLAAEQPLLLAVDDAHWADSSSLKALSYLAGRLSGAPVALLVATRMHEPDAPEALLDEFRSAPGALALTPAPLSAEAVARLVQARIPEADPKICAAFSEATGGNPFLVQELLRSVSANGEMSQADPAAAVRDASVLSIGDRVMRRVEQLGPAAPALASAMAVLGPEGPLRLACGVASLTGEEGGRIANGLRRIDVLTSEDPFEFTHPLVRRSIYDALSVTESRALHASAAELLREEGAYAEVVAAQLTELPPAGSSAVAEALVAAAEEARARAAPHEAIRWFRRALEEEAPQPPRATILEGLGVLLASLRDPEAIGHLQEALAISDDPALRLRVAGDLAEMLAIAGQWEGSIEALDAVTDDIAGASPEAEAEIAAVRTGIMVYDPAFTATLARERPHLEELAARDGDASLAIAAFLTVQASHFGEGVERVRAYASRALEDGRLLRGRTADGYAIHVLGSLVEIDDHDWAQSACDLLGAAARERGSVAGHLVSSFASGWSHLRQGDLASGEAVVRAAVEAGNQAGLTMAATSGANFLQDAMIERPGHEDLAAFIETVELPEVFARTWSGANVLLVRGRLRLAKLDRGRAVADLRAAYEIQAALGWGPAASTVRSLLALALPAGEREEALTLAQEELELARAAGVPRYEGIALRALGMVTGGEDGIELLRQSASLLAGSPARYEHAVALVELGAALRRAQQRVEARGELTAGLELAHRCGAQRLMERAREELNAAGGRPRRIATTGAGSLTPSERRVADMAAVGATNREIAQELFVSEKTVETHLSHTYSKLEIAGAGARERLTAALGKDA